MLALLFLSSQFSGPQKCLKKHKKKLYFQRCCARDHQTHTNSIFAAELLVVWWEKSSKEKKTTQNLVGFEGLTNGMFLVIVKVNRIIFSLRSVAAWSFRSSSREKKRLPLSSPRTSSAIKFKVAVFLIRYFFGVYRSSGKWAVYLARCRSCKSREYAAGRKLHTRNAHKKTWALIFDEILFNMSTTRGRATLVSVWKMKLCCIELQSKNERGIDNQSQKEWTKATFGMKSSSMSSLFSFSLPKMQAHIFGCNVN